MKPIFVLVLVVGMLLTGTVNTILNKLQDNTCVENCDDPDPKRRHLFEQPLWQTVNMFLGESLCLIVYYVGVWRENKRIAREAEAAAAGAAGVAVVHPDSPGVATADDVAGEETSPLIPPTFVAHTPQPMTGYYNFLLWLPTLCDMIATTLMNVGLIHISASVYQMLRGSVVLFTGTLSVLFLNRRHPLYRWFALVMVFLGVATVGMSSIVEHASSPPPADSHNDAEHPYLMGTKPSTWSIIGVLLVILAQTFTALQFVIEEKIMSHFHLPAMKAVGLEGIFGLITTGTLMPVLYFTVGKDTGNFFDLPVGFSQLFGFSQVFWAGVGITFSIASFNWFGLSVTRSISATSRSTIDTCRTLFIWIISLSLGWEHFRWLQVLGFVILIYGTFLFNDVVSPPPFAGCRRPPVPQEDLTEEVV